MIDLPTRWTTEQLDQLAQTLTGDMRAALRPCAKDRRCLLKPGLGHWSKRPGHRYPSIKLSSRGYALRNHLGLTKPKG